MVTYRLSLLLAPRDCPLPLRILSFVLLLCLGKLECIDRTPYTPEKREAAAAERAARRGASSCGADEADDGLDL